MTNAKCKSKQCALFHIKQPEPYVREHATFQEKTKQRNINTTNPKKDIVSKSFIISLLRSKGTIPHVMKQNPIKIQALKNKCKSDCITSHCSTNEINQTNKKIDNHSHQRISLPGQNSTLLSFHKNRKLLSHLA